jgi:hypothetical protein
MVRRSAPASSRCVAYECRKTCASMAFHHFRDPRRVARECRRILADGGPVFVHTGTRDRIANYPYVPYFPRSCR